MMMEMLSFVINTWIFITSMVNPYLPLYVTIFDRLVFAINIKMDGHVWRENSKIVTAVTFNQKRE